MENTCAVAMISMRWTIKSVTCDLHHPKMTLYLNLYFVILNVVRMKKLNVRKGMND